MSLLSLFLRRGMAPQRLSLALRATPATVLTLALRPATDLALVATPATTITLTARHV